jgi:hypothetical protein
VLILTVQEHVVPLALVLDLDMEIASEAAGLRMLSSAKMLKSHWRTTPAVLVAAAGRPAERLPAY